MSGENTARRQTVLQPTSQPVVLVVEDEVILRMHVCEQLRLRGFEVLEAHDSDEAVLAVQARPDIGIVFTDIVMPGKMNGADLALDWLAQHRPEVPVLMTSGVIKSHSNVGRGRHFLPKPYDIDVLDAELRGLLALHAIP